MKESEIKDLVSTVKRINARVNNTRALKNLNAGGCGFFAGMTKYYLDILGYNSKLVYANGCGSWFRDADEIVTNINSRETSSAAHVFLKVHLQGRVYLYFDGFNYSTKPDDIWYTYKFRGIPKYVPFNMRGDEYMYNALVKKPYDWNKTYLWYDNRKLAKIIHEEFTRTNKTDLQGAQHIVEVLKEIKAL